MKRITLHIGILVILVALLIPAVSFSQLHNIRPINRARMAEQVKREFLHAWSAYKQYAWGHDALKPLSKTSHDWYAESLYMTPLDALDTMTLMGFKEEADSTREYVATHMSFNKDIYVKNFEIVIRLLGGLLSNYQLSGDKRLLDLAEDLGTRLLPAFNSPTGMPYVFVNLKTGAVRGAESNPAEIGTLLVEFGTLSKLTKKQIFYDKAKNALVQVFNRRSKIGLVSETINVETGEWVDTTSHISGGIDSYYEYLLKCWMLFDDKDCERMWKESIAPVNTYLADETDTSLWYGYSDMKTGKRVATKFGALDAFFPAVLALSGDRVRAAKLEYSAYQMWNVAGIEPEVLDYKTMTVLNGKYHLRPEIIESAYYLYYFTKDPQYQQMGRVFLDSLVAYCKLETGFAALRDVRTKEKMDEMESFFLAETLKYLYLLYAPLETINLHNVVFNTEAHPIRKTW